MGAGSVWMKAHWVGYQEVCQLGPGHTHPVTLGKTFIFSESWFLHLQNENKIVRSLIIVILQHHLS